MSFPFKEAVSKYRQKSWAGTLPLPEKKKEKPPEHMTGKQYLDYPSVPDIKKWLTEAKWKNGNICLRLGPIKGAEQWEVVGIDVDHYESGGKDKKGWDQLKDLEAKFGVLPDTAISSARDDGKSGIRYFRVPKGLSFRGKAAKDIDIIYLGYRYAIVWPSIHPGGTVYLWYKAGDPIDGNGTGDIPNPMELAVLPDSWIDYLTASRTEFTVDAIDVDSSVDDVYDWTSDTVSNFSGEMCYRMREKVDKIKERVITEAAMHSIMTDGHWNICSLAFEGHYGLNAALREIETAWMTELVDKRDGKGRTRSEVQGEIFRSRIGALRKMKAAAEQRISIGALAVPPDDPECCGASLALKPVQEYDMNDDGNGEHFVDLFTGENGPIIRYVDGYGWIIWDEGDEEKEIGPHWIRDRDGDQEIRRMWIKVKERQQAYADSLWAIVENEIAAAKAAGLPSFGNAAAVPNEIKIAKANWKPWAEFANKSGQNKNANDAIRNARSKKRIQISINDLDKNPNLIGVKNGVLDLNNGDVKLRKAKPEDYITMNTNVAWKEPTKFAQDKWDEYLDTFLPDPEERKVAQIALGHCLPGGNPEKIVIILMGDPNTGKSTMVNTMEAALGDYAVSVDHSVFQTKTFNPTLAACINARMAIASEFDKEDRLSAAMIKRVSGGTDKVGTDIKFSMEKLVGVPQFVVILSTNGFPPISGADKALFNRMHVIPFTVVPECIDKEMAFIVRTVCPEAVLKWAVEGYKMYKAMGKLPISTKIKEATQAFNSNLTDIGAFMEDCIEMHEHMESKKLSDWKFLPDWCVKTGSLYTAFERWWNQENFRPDQIPSRRTFMLKVAELGLKRGKITINEKQEWYFVGIKIRPFIDSNVIPFKASLN